MFKQTLKIFFYRLSYLGQYQAYLINKIKKNNYLPVLSLHRVSSELNSYWPPLSPNIFDALLAYLKKHFTITTFHELESTTKNQKPKLILSFDDGYYDFIEYAMPILKKHNLRVNQNIIPSLLLNQKPLWNIELYDFFNAAPLSLLKEMEVPGLNIKNAVTRTFNKTHFGIQVSRYFKNLTLEKRKPIMQFLEERYFIKLSNFPKTRMIHLSEMDDVLSEHEVGMHSYSHNSMNQESMTYFMDDFQKCKLFFEQNQFPGRDIYAFPNGNYNDEQLEYLLENGVKYILLTGDRYAKMNNPTYPRFNIAALGTLEAIFQSLGIKQYL